ncbi:D123-domain-containing protein [Neoconidiobolus thromboides FSU 785]|nr:D123-domain-containing protein [Neoconidiobolus thromboides FSU 785]
MESKELITDLKKFSYREVLQCSYTEWYQLFEPYLIKSQVIPLNNKLIEYLKSDSMKIPSKFLLGLDKSQLSDDDEEEEESEEEESEEEEENEEQKEPELNKLEVMELLEELNIIVSKSIEELQGSVIPKLNWSAPKDAIWISASKNLQCKNLGDILLLLKSSDDIEYDLNRAFELCYDKERVDLSTVNYNLILKTWFNMDHGFEFRCFILNGKLVGISQRDSNYYSYLKQEKEWVIKLIINFFNHVIKEKFPLTNYTVDIYVVKLTKSIKILDFNPVSTATHPLLFEWSELLELNNDDKLPIFRFIESEVDSQYNRSIRSGLNSYPIDLVHSNSNEVDQLLNQIKIEDKQ